MDLIYGTRKTSNADEVTPNHSYARRFHQVQSRLAGDNDNCLLILSAASSWEHDGADWVRTPFAGDLAVFTPSVVMGAFPRISLTSSKHFPGYAGVKLGKFDGCDFAATRTRGMKPRFLPTVFRQLWDHICDHFWWISKHWHSE